MLIGVTGMSFMLALKPLQVSGYTYVQHCPTMFTDPLGLWRIERRPTEKWGYAFPDNNPKSPNTFDQLGKEIGLDPRQIDKWGVVVFNKTGIDPSGGRSLSSDWASLTHVEYCKPNAAATIRFPNTMLILNGPPDIEGAYDVGSATMERAMSQAEDRVAREKWNGPLDNTNPMLYFIDRQSSGEGMYVDDAVGRIHTLSRERSLYGLVVVSHARGGASNPYPWFLPRNKGGDGRLYPKAIKNSLFYSLGGLWMANCWSAARKQEYNELVVNSRAFLFPDLYGIAVDFLKLSQY